MNIWEKYKLDKNEFEIVNKLPMSNLKYTYLLEKESYDQTYIKENNKLKLIAINPHGTSILLLFLKKYRKNPELLPKDLKHEYPMDFMSSEEIYKAMKLMLKPMNSFEEFKERLNLATKELMTDERRKYITRFGEQIVFIKRKEECGSGINIYGELIPYLKEKGEYHWDEAIVFDRDKRIFEYYYKEERTNDTPSKDNWSLHIKFYEEQHLYEYLLNQEICAVK